MNTGRGTQNCPGDNTFLKINISATYIFLVLVAHALYQAIRWCAINTWKIYSKSVMDKHHILIAVGKERKGGGVGGRGCEYI